MSVSIIDQVNRLEKLLRILNDYVDNLRYHVIKAPLDAIEEALNDGLPVEIGSKYRWEYYERNRIDAENIINYINGICVPYLEGKLKKMKEVININN